MRSIGDLVSEVAGDENLAVDEEVASVDGYEEAEAAGPTPDGMTIIPGSLCMSCQGSGVTRIMFTKIPHFRELIVSSFECDECGERNTEVQFGGEIQEKGVRYRATIRDGIDLNRQVIKSDSARMTVPALELEIPAATQRGIISTIEGVLSRAARELDSMQPIRHATEPEQARKIQGVVDALRCMAAGDELPFMIELDDPSGNSFVQARDVASPDRDNDLELVRYDRSGVDNISLGLHPSGAAPLGEERTLTSMTQEERTETSQAHEERPRICRERKSIDGVDRLVSGDEVMTFQVSCPHCRADGSEQMCIAKIPHFKECVIMSFACAKCGFRNSEVKAGGAVPLKGQTTTLTCADAADLNRDILKSDTASLAIPSLALEMSRGTLGGARALFKHVPLAARCLTCPRACRRLHYDRRDPAKDQGEPSRWQSFCGRRLGGSRSSRPLRHLLVKARRPYRRSNVSLPTSTCRPTSQLLHRSAPHH